MNGMRSALESIEETVLSTSVNWLAVYTIQGLSVQLKTASYMQVAFKCCWRLGSAANKTFFSSFLKLGSGGVTPSV